ncbi:9108_t:CDS:2 [Gigaspora rosea]|nr:9108_t:CDS:2 [Gigaspora rosea]
MQTLQRTIASVLIWFTDLTSHNNIEPQKGQCWDQISLIRAWYVNLIWARNGTWSVGRAFVETGFYLEKIGPKLGC